MIRNRLWSINIAHGETLARISGSPIFQALDFNMCILTEDAELVMNAPFILFLAAGAPQGARYVMEHFAADPGIREGDMYLVSDPWVSSTHQMDVMILCPVFRDGKLFAWVSNAGHQYDLGGIVPGGWPQNAPDIYSDPILFTPFKIVDGGVLRKDLDAMYCRNSRMQDLVALDLRAQISGCRFAAESLQELCDDFGGDVVKAAMRRVLDDSQATFAEKLTRIPDGTFSEVIWVDERMPGDRANYRIQLNVHKEGDRLRIDNTGTDEQVEGPLGFTYASFSGSILGALSITMLWEQLFSLGGGARNIDFRPTPGLLSCVDYPAAVSGGVTNAAAQVQAMLGAVNRMLSCDPELKRDVVGNQYTCPILLLTGENDRDQPFGTAVTDISAVGSAGRPDRDGVDTGGPNWSPLMRLLNVESMEQFYPIVYLYRREGVDGGGAGRQRGGTGIDLAFMPYRAKVLELVTNCGASTISTHGANGMFGGYPSPTVEVTVMKDSDVRARLAASLVPKAGEVAADESFLVRGKSNGTELLADDVVACRIPGGGGYGDPLERSAGQVVRDVELGYVSIAQAKATYGVVLTAEGDCDDSATALARAEQMEARRSWPRARDIWPQAERAERSPATGEPRRAVHEVVDATDQEDERVLACSRCDTVLGRYGDSYKMGLLVSETPIDSIIGIEDPAYFVDHPMVARRYCCPGCQVLMATEVARAEEPPFAEMMLEGSNA